MKTTKAIEKLTMQLFAVRSTIKRFQESEKEIAAELRPCLTLNEPVVFSGVKVELVQVPGYEVDAYTVPTGDRINVGRSLMEAPPAS